MATTGVRREDLAERYFAQLPYPPYPVQEEALLAWFMTDQGVLVCAPTGTGKTLIAEAALFEALHTGKIAYYTTPLIALTEQKFQEMQTAAARWGFPPEAIGLVTGNRRVNPHARVLVVVAEILLNRLLNPEAFDFHDVNAVVMDEFHSFADNYRGIVWELSLAMLPKHVRLLLLSATVGNAPEFLAWLARSHGRKLDLVEGTERKIPLSYQWVPDQLLGEQLELMTEGDPETRRTPALVFAFNRDECWSIAEMLKGLHLLGEEQRGPLLDEVNKLNWSQGVGPKLKQILQRGVGVHHAGMLPKYRRVVEDLYQRKLLAVCVCTETLAAGINLPARSVVLTTLVKGPFGEKKIIDASTAHQIFGRAGRPQYDREGFVYALAHEDDVKILRWQIKYDQIPEDTKDPGLMKAKKALKKKKPTRRDNETYWNEAQFQKLREAPAGKLYSKGPLPWRLLAYLLQHSPEVDRIRTVVRKRLMDEPRIKAAEVKLDQMLGALHVAGFVKLEPEPPAKDAPKPAAPAAAPVAEPMARGLFGQLVPKPKHAQEQPPPPPPRPVYSPRLAQPTAELSKLLVFRSIHPLYGAFLLDHLGIADRNERIQLFESVLELPKPIWKYVRVPWPEDLPPGPLAARLDPILLTRGLMVAPPSETDEERRDRDDRPPPPLMLADKLRLLFDADYPDVGELNTGPVWAAGELLVHGGDFNKFVRAADLTKQEGLIFRHILRLILLLGEFMEVCPKDTTPAEWQADLRELSEKLTASCREVDPESTDKAIEEAHAADPVEGESTAKTVEMKGPA